jgi:hypothetical protein
VCRIFTARVVTQNFLHVFADMVTHAWVSLCAVVCRRWTAGKGFGWAARDNGLRVSRFDSNHVHQSKVAMTRIARVSTRGSSTCYLTNKVLVTLEDFWARVAA